jgi:hypothetical protein
MEISALARDALTPAETTIAATKLTEESIPDAYLLYLRAARR